MSSALLAVALLTGATLAVPGLGAYARALLVTCALLETIGALLVRARKDSPNGETAGGPNPPTERKDGTNV